MNAPLRLTRIFVMPLLATIAAFSAGVQAAPTRLTCTFDGTANAGNTSERVWTYDTDTHTVDWHKVGEKVPTFGNACNHYFITDSLIGFSTSSATG